MISIGSRPSTCFPAGYYAYVGSALGGLEGRVRRHLRSGKKLHWHIDYLLREAAIAGIVVAENVQRCECDIARALERHLECVHGFGASDCRCPSHLFRADDKNQLKSAAFTALRSQSLTPCCLEMAGVHD
jgi:Uri superfamily endonuclease